MADPVPASGIFLPVIAALAAAVVAVPLFQKLRLGAVLGYMAAGVILGPAALGVFHNPAALHHVADLGVVLMLFIIGLDLQLARLRAMKRDIFGLGVLIWLLTAGVLSVTPLTPLNVPAAMIAGLALALSSTAVAVRSLEGSGQLNTPFGQRTFAVLLWQDIAVVPLLALIPLLAGFGVGAPALNFDPVGGLKIAGTLITVVGVARYGLDPFFALLARTRVREVMAAGALLVVLGTASVMVWAGLSAALGAFLAGVMLAESRFRHQLEADIEPFRGLLLGLFFMSVGMGLDMALLAHSGVMIVLAAGCLFVLKAAIATCVMRLTGSPWTDALRGGILLGTAGEFALVIFPLALAAGVLTGNQAAWLSALVALSMVFATPMKGLVDVLIRRLSVQNETADEDFSGAGGSVLMIGFGRFAQIAAQVLLAEGVPVTIIDRNIKRIRTAETFGFKVYYGDGTRLDVLRAAGAATADIVCITIDDQAAALKIVEIVREEFPLARIHVQAYDRTHALALMNAEVDYQIRETLESALLFGQNTLEALGIAPQRAVRITEEVRKLDSERLMLQQQGGLYAGLELLHTQVKPEPLVKPTRAAEILNPDEARAAEQVL
jgi:monovalent cation:proton antiporter-2 (CPA2) family protein